MGWFRVSLTEEEQEVVKVQRETHPDPFVRRRMWTLWLLHCGVTRQKAAELVGVACSTVGRIIVEYRSGGLDGFGRREHSKPVSELAAHRQAIRDSFEHQPVRTIAEASQRIYELTGIRRGPSQVRKFLRDLGMNWQRVRAIPVPPKKTWLSMQRTKLRFMTMN